jgi:hypothetical protein
VLYTIAGTRGIYYIPTNKRGGLFSWILLISFIGGSWRRA